MPFFWVVRGWVQENVARVCREAGGRVRTMDVAWKSLLTDYHCGVGLSRDGVAQRALQPRWGSPWRVPGEGKKGLTPVDWRGWPCQVGGLGRGGRWSAETSVFLRSLAAAKARGAASVAWGSRWQGLLAAAPAHLETQQHKQQN